MDRNEKGLPVLRQRELNAIFDCVYGTQDSEERADSDLRGLIRVLKALQDYNYQYRSMEAMSLFQLFDEAVGPMMTNSDGTILWLSLGLAIKELYGIRYTTLQSLMKQVTVRK
ncbi:MAG: hypothetical protein NVS2B16_30530 [Chloroflexota bacterium]